MSVQCNTYCMTGAIFPYAPFKGDGWFEKHEPYLDNAFKGIRHHDGLCILRDGMNGEYVAIGMVIAKSENWRGFEQPIEVPTTAIPDAAELHRKISELVPEGLPVVLGRFVISHYR